ncbi:MAG TPA: nitrite reductase small subunit NirD [Acidimicrobiales bacterium]|jgi:NAD(P)H-dependent nitrite reductase small subunit|nr:nitrite reductase small subunit NirD [Acidimicrobiales bacterium]
MTVVDDRTSTWIDVCAVDVITPDRGVAARIADRQIALFVLSTGDVYALDNRDPFSAANVLCNGIIGDHNGVPTVASPVYKQRFALATGKCLDDPDVSVARWEARIDGGRVLVREPR